MELEALRDAHPDFISLGASLVAISPQVPEHSRRIVEEKELRFDLLSDPGNAVAAAFGVRFVLSDDLRAANRGLGLDLPSFNGDDSWSLPIPARFIIDTKGRVRYAVHDPDYTKRTSTQHTLGALRELA